MQLLGSTNGAALGNLLWGGNMLYLVFAILCGHCAGMCSLYLAGLLDLRLVLEQVELDICEQPTVRT